jgi:hypothetical protein
MSCGLASEKVGHVALSSTSPYLHRLYIFLGEVQISPPILEDRVDGVDQKDQLAPNGQSNKRQLTLRH